MKTKIDELRKQITDYDLHVYFGSNMHKSLLTLLDIIEKQHKLINKINEDYYDTTECADSGIFYEMFPEHTLDDTADAIRETTEMLEDIEL